MMKGQELREHHDSLAREYRRKQEFSDRHPDNGEAEISALCAHVAMLRAEIKLKDHLLVLSTNALKRCRAGRMGS